jgi:acyl-CoA thioesterase FadM
VFFVVYRMVVLHARPSRYGELIRATTWVSRLRRRTLSTREVRLRVGEELVAAATQEWVHVDAETFKPKQGDKATAAAFPAVEVEPSVKLPKFDALEGSESTFRFRMWQTWADPLDHANHPAYIDWCDEAISRHMVEAGIEPTLLRPVAERVSFRDSVLPGEEVRLRTKRAGIFDGKAVVLEHRLETDRGLAAEATTIRGLVDEDDCRLIEAWG